MRETGNTCGIFMAGKKKKAGMKTAQPAQPVLDKRIPIALMLFSYANTTMVSLFLGAAFIANGITVTENPADISNSFSLFFYMLFAAVSMLLIMKFYKGKLLFKLMELTFVFAAMTVLSSLFLGETDSVIFASLAAIVRALLPDKTSVLLYGSAAVVGGLLGASLDFVPAMVFAVALGVYDYIAVFKTKHIIELAQSLSRRDASFSIKAGPNDNAVELGLGYFVIGSTLSVSALKLGTFPDFGFGVAGALGSVFGLGTMFWYLEKRRGYFPAVPPIVLGSFFFISLYWLSRALLSFLRF